MLGLISELVYVSHMVVLELNYSVNLQVFFGSIFPLLIFDVLPSDDIFEVIFNLSEVPDEPRSEKFDEIGYGSMLIYGNLGSLLIIQVLAWVIIGAIFLLLKFLPNRFLHKVIRRFL
jgi:hypothetical protein